MINNNSNKKYYTYGKYTLGGGNFIKKFTSKNSNAYSDKIISKFETMVWQDLCRISLQDKLSKLTVLNIGSGREALAFEKLGALDVCFVDKSKVNFNKVNFLKKINKTKVRSLNFDICSKIFSAQKLKFDLAYLNGVLHHTRDPQLALHNIKSKINIKQHAGIWLYLYQAGSVYNLIRFLQNKIAKISKINNQILYKAFKSKFNDRTTELNLDDVGCDYLNILSSKTYQKIFERLNLKIIYSKDFYSNIKMSIRLNTKSCLVFIKVSNYKNKKIINYEKNEILNFKNYEIEDQKIIKEFNREYFNLINILNKKSKKSIINFIILLAKSKKKYDHLSSYEEKKKLLWQIIKEMKKFTL